MNRFDLAIGGLAGKRVVDLGSGPGHYALEFARRGADVTCVDVSAAYIALARRRLESERLTATFAIGYMDDVVRLTGGQFDGAFCNVSWYYCMHDLRFAGRIISALRPGGVAVVRAHNSDYEPDRGPMRRAIYFLNETLCWKIGHPHPPRGRILFAFQRIRGCEAESEYSDPLLDVVIARRQAY